MMFGLCFEKYLYLYRIISAQQAGLACWCLSYLSRYSFYCYVHIED